MSSGWICLHRDIQDHWVCKNPEHFRAWVLILMGVNHASRKVAIGPRVLIAERGESLRSCEQWAQVFGPNWDRFKVRRFFRLLQRDGMIRTKNERKTLRLTVCNYDSYQSERTNGARRLPETRTKRARNVHTNNNENNGNNEEQRAGSACEEEHPFDDPEPLSRPITDEDRWRMEIQAQPWARDLKRARAKVGPRNWTAWAGLLEHHPLARVLEALPMIPADDRWPDQVEVHLGGVSRQRTKDWGESVR